MKVGSIEVIPLVDSVVHLDPTELFTGTAPGKGSSPQDWEAHRDLLDEDGRMQMVVRSFLVERGGRRILIDGGYGPGSPVGTAQLLDSLGAVGLQPADIDDVVLTHLHSDHIGWSSVDGVPTFPNATYRCDGRDWAHFVEGPPGDRMNDLAREKLLPIRDRFEHWDGDTTLAPGLDVLHAPGHTPGNAVVVFSDGDERALMLGDAVHCPVMLLDAEWQRIIDVDPVLARRTMERLVAEIESEGLRVTGAHFPGLDFGRVLTAQGTRRWVVG
jgi:glyoxylase-like metal-dependent hydrolase (beta-lactamase superfamily II)